MYNPSTNPMTIELNRFAESDVIETNNVEITAIVHPEKEDLFDIKVLKYETLANYNSNIVDYNLITFNMSSGDYINKLLPSKENLEITVIKKYNNVVFSRNRYKLALLTVSFKDGTRDIRMSEYELNKMSMQIVTAQCLDRKAEALRVWSKNGIYYKTNVQSVILDSFKEAFKDIKVDNKEINYIFKMVKPNNMSTYNHIILPNLVKIMDIPSYLQNKDYGVYNGNIGTYISKSRKKKKHSVFKEEYEDTIFVYPLYNPEVSYENYEDKLVIYEVNDKQYTFIDKTYNDTGTTLEILSTDLSSNLDNSTNEILNSGNGFNNLKVDKILTDNVDVKSDGVVVKKSDYIVDVSVKRSDSLNVTTNVSATDNLYKERSSVLKTNGRIKQIQWSLSNTDLLLPGMPVVYVYVDENNKVQKVLGVLQSSYTVYNNDKRNAYSVLNVFLDINKREN